MNAYGRFWNLKEGTLEVLYRKDFDRAIAQAAKEVKEIELRVKRVIAIPVGLKKELFMQD